MVWCAWRLMWCCTVLGDWCDAVLFLETDVMLYFSWGLMWYCTFLGDWCDVLCWRLMWCCTFLGDWCDTVLCLETDVILYFAWRLLWLCTVLETDVMLYRVGDWGDVLCWRLIWCTVLGNCDVLCLGFTFRTGTGVILICFFLFFLINMWIEHQCAFSNLGMYFFRAGSSSWLWYWQR